MHDLLRPLHYRLLVMMLFILVSEYQYGAQCHLYSEDSGNMFCYYPQSLYASSLLYIQ